ncbi:hypothetical protein JQX13_50365 [Archangium violaceum]|uniref:hypothetical protein n=1 Tax=Archangium violaceum TaxID=83451 RepID=UPI00193BC450|nr:hypothetical protein [Archangium violaceum]QRK06053.1 hypothetical protein JQX13_38905 [Archangium violaceum]QRK08072.1 hypothetical protein JQX13_50365 [Archangium violaceum]
MNFIVRNNIGAVVKTDNLALAPAARSAGTRQGSTFAPGRWGSAVLVGLTGATTGTPTGFEVTYEVETRDGSDTDNEWVALKNMDGAAVELTVIQASKAVELDIDFQYIPVGHDELRVVETVSFTDGTTPTVVTGALLVLGGSSTLPV